MSEVQDGRQELLPVCKYHQRGYCRNRSQCNGYHSNTICKDRVCRNPDCRYQHPKVCTQYARNNGCKWQEKCAYKHNNPEERNKVSLLENEIRQLKSDIKQLNENMSELKIMMIAVQENKNTYNKETIKVTSKEIDPSSELPKSVKDVTKQDTFKC